MGLGQNIKYYWGAIRWKMLIIFAFFSVVSTILIGALSVAVLNVVIRRESAYLIEERIKTVVDNYKRFTPSLADGIDLPASNLPLVPQHSRSVWGDSQTLITVVPEEAIDRDRPSWLPKGSFTGIVVDQGSLEIRSFHEAEGARCCSTILVTTPSVDPSWSRWQGRPVYRFPTANPCCCIHIAPRKERRVKLRPISSRGRDDLFPL
jgi:hypothetical protein